MQREHVTNAETVIGTNYRKTKKNVSGGITTTEYSHILTGIKFTNNSSKQ